MAQTLLQMIQAVQRQLRLPQSATGSDPYALLITDWINKTQRHVLMEYDNKGIATPIEWTELFQHTTVNTVGNTPTTAISLPGGPEIKYLKSMYITGHNPIECLNDVFFSDQRKNATAEITPSGNVTVINNRPRWYRIYSNTDTSITVEWLPVPDQAYTVNVDAFIFPPYLVDDNDLPMLNSDLIVEGAILMEKLERGIADQGDIQFFQEMKVLGMRRNEINRRRVLLYRDM